MLLLSMIFIPQIVVFISLTDVQDDSFDQQLFGDPDRPDDKRRTLLKELDEAEVKKDEYPWRSVTAQVRGRAIPRRSVDLGRYSKPLAPLNSSGREYSPEPQNTEGRPTFLSV